MGIPLKIVSIFHVQRNENYAKYIELLTNLLTIISEGDMIPIAVRKQKAIVKLLRHQVGSANIGSLPLYICKLLQHICCNIKQIKIRYITFKYELLRAFLFLDDECTQFFNLYLVTTLFPNLQSIAIECSSLTKQVFAHIIAFLKETALTSLNNIIFHSPIAPSISFQVAQKIYSQTLASFDWSMNFEKKTKKLIVHRNKKNKHDRMCSGDIGTAHRKFIGAEKFVLGQALSLFADESITISQ